MTKQEALDFLTGEFSLSNLPESFQKLRDISNDPHSDVSDVVAVVRNDSELATRLMKMANSSLYNQHGDHVSTIEEASQRLGLRRILESSLAIGVIKEIDIDHEHFDLPNFWRRSLTIALISEEVYAIAPRFIQSRVEKNLLFTAGLLHDIGLLVLVQGFPREVLRVADHAIARDIPLYESERQLFGFTHQEIGRITFKKWNFPEVLQAAAGFHHEPLELKRRVYTPLVDTLYISDYIYCLGSDTPFRNPCKPVLHREVWNRVGIDPRVVDSLADKISEASEVADCLIHS